MTELLKVALELAFAEGSSRYKRLLEKVPKTHMLEFDGKWTNARELLQGSSIAGTNFIPTETLNTVIEGAQLRRCFQGLVSEYNTTADSYNIPLGTGGGYAQKYAPGATVKMREDALKTRPVTINNYKEAFGVTDEMLADSKIDEIVREAGLVGERLQNALEQDMLTVLLDNSGLEHDTSGSNQGYKAMVKARGKVRKAGFMPNAIVCCADAETMLLNDLVPSANAGAEDAIVQARLATLGMSLNECDVAAASSTYTWDYAANDNIGMIVLDTRAAGGIVFRQRIQLEDFKDVLAGISGAKATMRAGVQYAQANATCRVKY